MKRIATLFAIFHCVIAPAFAKKGTQSSGLVTHYWKANRLPASKAAMPCADDVERMKDIAAEQFGKMDLDSDGHKISVSKEAFKSASVFSTQANDAAVLSLSAEAPHPSNPDSKFKLSAQAICSPSTGRFELMSTSYQTVPKL